MRAPSPSRADFLQMSLAAGLGLGAAGRAAAQATGGGMLTRPIPSSGEALPVVGCGTWQTFDLDPPERGPLAETLRTLFAAGGSVIDSSPMYGRSEDAVGDVLARLGAQDRAFLATKVWTTGREAGVAQMRASARLLRDPVIDLMQVHNLVDAETHLATLAAWKREGRVRYVGVTHYTASAHAALETAMRRHRPDFVQLDYSAVDRQVEQRLLPTARDLGTAVIVNQPFGGGGLLRRLGGRPRRASPRRSGARAGPSCC